MSHEEAARDDRHKVSEETALSVRKRSLETRLEVLDLDKDEAFAEARQEQGGRERTGAGAERAAAFHPGSSAGRWSRKRSPRHRRWKRRQIQKDVAIIEENRRREAADIQRALARESEERDRDIALVAKAVELERAEVQRRLAVEEEERAREMVLVARDEALEAARVKKALAVEVEERNREIALIGKEEERERVDIQRYLARESEERDRQIALAGKTLELEEAESRRLEMDGASRAGGTRRGVRAPGGGCGTPKGDRSHQGREHGRTPAASRRRPRRRSPACTWSPRPTRAGSRRNARPRPPSPGPGPPVRRSRSVPRHREGGGCGRPGRGAHRGVAGREHPAPASRPKRWGSRPRPTRSRSTTSRDVSGACQDAHRGRARHPHRPGEGDGHRAHRRPHPHVRRRRRHRRQHPAALHLRFRHRRGARRRRAVAAGGLRERLAQDGISPGSSAARTRAR